MYKVMFRSLALALLAAVPGTTQAQDVKIGLIGILSGPYATWGKEYKEAVDLYLEQHNGKNGNPNVTVLWRDVGGNSPPRARQLAQDLIVRDKVALLGGLEFTPNVLALADVITESKTPFVAFGSATAFITDKSPYFIRAAYTQWTVQTSLGRWASENGLKRCAILVADFATGEDTIKAFTYGYSGKVTRVIRVPLNTTDFSSYLQLVQDDSPDCLDVFLPLGPMSINLIKAFEERGLKKKGVRFLADGQTPETDLNVIGDAASLGLITALPYGPYLDNEVNRKFLGDFQAKFGSDRLPTMLSVGAYDGMEIFFQMLRKTAPKHDPEQMMAAIKGYSWQSPRGPVSIDPDTREIVQNIYIRRVEKVGGRLINKEFFTYPNVKEIWHQSDKKN